MHKAITVLDIIYVYNNYILYDGYTEQEKCSIISQKKKYS